MKRHISCISWTLIILILCVAMQSQAQTIITQFDPLEKQGERPYEKIWGNHKEPGIPTVKFDQLQGWSMQVEGGSQGILQLSRAQDIWGRPLASFKYRGNGDKSSTPRVIMLPPETVAIPDDADVVELWAYDNRLPWDRPTLPPPTTIQLHLRDSDGKNHIVNFGDTLWEEWWLLHRRLPKDMHSPVYLESIEVSGGYQEEWLELFIDSIRFYKEILSPLDFTPLAKRNLTLFEGQDYGANTGQDKLEFPTREETILPMHFSGKYKNEVKSSQEDVYTFKYSGKDCTVSYSFEPAKGISSIKGYVDGKLVGNLMDEAAIKKADDSASSNISKTELKDNTVTAEYDDGTILRLRIWQKSLVIDVINRTSEAAELMFGRMSGLKSPRTIAVPHLADMKNRDITPCVLLSKAGDRNVFATILLDFYRSNSSELYSGKALTTEDTAVINGAVRYYKKTDGKLNPMYERFFLTVSPMFEEVLPTVPNPVCVNAEPSIERLWQESWGPGDYEIEKKRSRMIRAYGIEKLIQCNHESTWRDGNEGFTMRIHSAPKRGGDEVVKDFVAHQRSLGWFSGLYTNYRDYAPVGELWDPDAVVRGKDGDWVPAWRRCYALKPIRGVEFQKRLAPQIRAMYNSNSVYTDVLTISAPWHYTDYDARLPGAGTFAQTFYGWGEVLRNDSKTHGPTISEGGYEWMYAGLAEGSYGFTYSGTPIAETPLLPVFGLYQIHTKECDVGMGWTEFFCKSIPDWKSSQNIDYAIDRFLLNTLAYGHIGYLVEEIHGIDRTCRSYYMLQQVQSRYGLKKPLHIAYWDGSELRNVSEAIALDLPKTHRQMYVEYEGGLKLWLNDNPDQNWMITAGDTEVRLPPAGWAAYHEKDGLISYSALKGSGKVDYIKSKAYTYQDGRGKWYEAEAAASNGGLAITLLPNNGLQVIHISGKGAFTIKRPYGVKGRLVSCEAYDTDGKKLESPAVSDMSNRTNIKPVDGAIKYILKYSAKP